MMDGQVGAIRAALDREDSRRRRSSRNAAKHASAFYWPVPRRRRFRPPVRRPPHYQKDPANLRESSARSLSTWRKVPDIVMVKPALAYLDVIRAARERFDAPLAAYS